MKSLGAVDDELFATACAKCLTAMARLSKTRAGRCRRRYRRRRHPTMTTTMMGSCGGTSRGPNRPRSAPPRASDSIISPTTALPARRDGLERERDGPPPLSSSSDRVLVLPAPEGGPVMDQDYRPPDDGRTAGGVGCVGVGLEDVRVDCAPRGGWDGM
jgi:hypothetical protein